MYKIPNVQGRSVYEKHVYKGSMCTRETIGTGTQKNLVCKDALCTRDHLGKGSSVQGQYVHQGLLQVSGTKSIAIAIN